MIRHKDYLLVSLVDREAKRFKVEYSTLRTFRTKDEDSWVNDYPLPPGSWQLIGLASELTEEQKKEVCEEVIHPGEPIYYKVYNEPRDEDGYRAVSCTDVARAFDSLLRSHNLNASTTVILKLIQP